jgi:hypothetical protein
MNRKVGFGRNQDSQRQLVLQQVSVDHRAMNRKVGFGRDQDLGR